MKIKILKNALTPEIYTDLRKTANFIEYKKEDIEIALKNTLFSVVIYHEDKPIGISRVVGDGKVAFFIKDVVVHPDYQNKSIGKTLMQTVLSYISEVACDRAYIGLMATKGKESFYQSFGFIERPNNQLGSGMVMFYDKN